MSGDRVPRRPAQGAWAPTFGFPGRSAETSAGTLAQEFLDAIADRAVWATPIRNESGEIVDFELRAASPTAMNTAGLIGLAQPGRLMRQDNPEIGDTEVWECMLRVMESGKAEEIARYEHSESEDGVVRHANYAIRVARIGDGLLISWTRLDEEERLAMRLRHTERLGNLGWVHWGLYSGEIIWSPQLYAIHGRDPDDGPLDLQEYRAIVHPDDLVIFDQAIAMLTETDGPCEFEVRIRVPDGLRLIRACIEARRDIRGRPIEVHGVLQDITHWQRTADQLADVRQRLEEESQLTAELQHIIMPVQNEPFPEADLEVAVRYLPAQMEPLGGDWYQAIHVSDEEVLLAVGDVAGHGLPAASAMAKLRHAITGLAFAQHDPGEILVVLNRLLQRMRPDVIATAVVAHYRSTDRTFTWAHAGHPPILLVRGDTVRPLFHTGMMLGVSQQVTHCCDRVRLEPDDLVVMFTDGLIERPGRDLAEGLDVLCTAIADAVRARPADRLAAVMGVLEPSNPRDDTCMLVARVMPARAPIPATA